MYIAILKIKYCVDLAILSKGRLEELNSMLEKISEEGTRFEGMMEKIVSFRECLTQPFSGFYFL